MRTGVRVPMKEGAQERVWGQMEKDSRGKPEGLKLMRCRGWQMRKGWLAC